MNKFLFKVLRFSGLPFLFRQLIQKNKVTILMFHDIDIETADMSFRYLKKAYNIIRLDQFLNNCLNDSDYKLPKRALIITFDDGHVGNHRILPVIKKYKIPITIFLCSGIVGTKRNFWFEYDKLKDIVPELKKIPNKERLTIMNNEGFNQEKEFDIAQSLSKEQIQEMATYINMQAHTMFHPCLPKCNNKDAENEIYQSKRVLEEKFGFTINAFAYPNGDYSDREISMLKKAGYKCAITVDFGFNTKKSDLFRLKRISANDTTNINELIVKSSGLWEFLKTRNGSRQNHGFTDKIEN